MFVLQIKYKSFLNIYSFCKKKIFLDHKKYICYNFAVNSIISSLKFRSSQSVVFLKLALPKNINELLEKNIRGYLFLVTLRAEDLEHK